MTVLDNGLCCRLCKMKVHLTAPINIYHLRIHFLIKHLNCPMYSADRISYIWIYSNRTHVMKYEDRDMIVCRVYSSLIVELFPQLLFVKWENMFINLLLKFAKECTTEKRKFISDLDTITVSGDAYDKMKKTIMEQNYNCLFCNAEFNGAPSAELLAMHFDSLQCKGSINVVLDSHIYSAPNITKLKARISE